MKLPLMVVTLFLVSLLISASGNAAAAYSRSELTTADRTLQVDTAVQMYWIDADMGTIRRANSDGSGAIEDLIASGQPTSLALDLAAGRLYWTDTNAGKIRWVSLDDFSSHHDLYSSERPTSLALDTVNGELYWTDQVPGTIRRANVDGTSPAADILVLEGEPTSLALDSANRDMYWTDGATGKIRRAKMDRSILEPIDDLATGLVWPDNLALDLAQGQMYWTEWAPGRIRRAGLPSAGSSSIENLVDFTSGLPTGLALDLPGGKMYWTDGVNHTVQSSDLTGTSFAVTDVFTASDGLKAPEGIALPIAPSVASSVPLIYWVDEEAQRIQRNAGEDGNRTVEELHLVNAEGGSVTLDMPGSIALDPIAGKMYWTDDGAEGESDGRIQRADLDGSNVEDLVSGLADPVGIALDLRAGRLYWADRHQGAIYRGTLGDITQEGLLPSHEAVLANLDRPYQIALDTFNGHMYWTERGENTSKVRRADLNGNNVTDIQFGLVAPLNPFGMALDPVAGRMYWSERSITGGEDVIAGADLDGQNGAIVVRSAYHSLSGIAVNVNDGRIYWTDEETGSIRRMDPASASRAVEVVVTGLSSPEGIAIFGPYLSSTRLALTALYRSTDGPNWTNNRRLAERCARWGMARRYTTENGRVIHLSLRYNQLSGTMPSELGDLSKLAYLDLEGNQLSGPIPQELGDLASLAYLDLDYNRLSGPIPTNLGNEANLIDQDNLLQWLYLSGNELTGPDTISAGQPS